MKNDEKKSFFWTQENERRERDRNRNRNRNRNCNLNKNFFFSSRRRKHNQLTIIYGDDRSIDLRMYIILYCRLFN